MSRIAFFFAVATASWGQQAHVNLDWNPQANREGFKPFGATLISPEVHADRRVTFRVNAAKAQEVILPNGPLMLGFANDRKPIPFGKGDDGVWTLTIGPLTPNLYVYKIMIDGATVPDPNNTIAGVGDQPPYSMLVVPGDGPAYYDAQPVPHGTVTRHVYHSKVTGGEREMYVYLPPGYSSKKKYPVLYLFGGSGELAVNWAIEGRAGFILDNLIAEGKAVPMIIAMPNNQVVHRGDPDWRTKGPDILERDLREHIIPLVDQAYSTVRTPRGRAMAGLSMGGGHTQTVGFRSLDLFGSFGVLSAGDRESETRSAKFLNDPSTNQKVDYLLLAQGTYEPQGMGPTGAGTAALKAALEKHKIRFEYYEGGGGAHDWATWRHLLAMKLLPGLWRKH